MKNIIASTEYVLQEPSLVYNGKMVRSLLAVATLIIISLETAIALLPPTARDALIYHLAYPKLYLQHGRVFELPFAFYSYYPMNTEVLYAIPVYLGRDWLASLIHMGFGILTALLIYRYIKNRADKTYAVLGAFIFLSTPVVIRLSTIPYVDLALGVYSTAAVLALLRWRENDPRRVKWLIASAVSAGLAAGTKYNGLYIPLILAFMTLHISRKGNPLRSCLIFLSISTAVASPWYIKNLIQTGNPFFPLFFNILGGLKIPEQPTVPVLLKRHLFYGEGWFDILLVPFRVFFQGRDDSMQFFDGALNPVLLVSLPFAFRRGDSDIRYLGVFSIYYFFLVFFTADMQVRFLLPILPVLTIVAVIGLKNITEWRIQQGAGTINSLKKWLIPVVVSTLLSLNLIYLTDYFGEKDPVPYLMGRMTRDEYLLKHLRGYEACRYINRNLPKQARILMVYAGDRGYYVDRDYYYNSYLSGQPLKEALDRAGTASGVAERLRGMGITHILMDERLFHEFMGNNVGEEGMALFSSFSREYLTPLHSSEGYTIYEVKS